MQAICSGWKAEKSNILWIATRVTRWQKGAAAERGLSRRRQPDRLPFGRWCYLMSVSPSAADAITYVKCQGVYFLKRSARRRYLATTVALCHATLNATSVNNHANSNSASISPPDQHRNYLWRQCRNRCAQLGGWPVR